MSYLDDNSQSSGCAGFFAAAVGAPLGGIILLALVALVSDPRGFDMDSDVLVGAVVVGTIIASIVMAVIGLPVTWLLQNLKLEYWWVYVPAGAVAGGAFFAWMLGAPARSLTDELLLLVGWGAVSGAIGAFLWWYTYRRHVRADVDERETGTMTDGAAYIRDDDS